MSALGPDRSRRMTANSSTSTQHAGPRGWGRLTRLRTGSRIIYTFTDEAPALATHSFLKVLQAYAATPA